MLSSEQLKSISKGNVERLKDCIEIVFNKLDDEKIVEKEDDNPKYLPESECEKSLLSARH